MSSSQKVSLAYVQGFNSANSGGRFGCPYQDGSSEAIAWRTGYESVTTLGEALKSALIAA